MLRKACAGQQENPLRKPRDRNAGPAWGRRSAEASHQHRCCFSQSTLPETPLRSLTTTSFTRQGPNNAAVLSRQHCPQQLPHAVPTMCCDYFLCYLQPAHKISFNPHNDPWDRHVIHITGEETEMQQLLKVTHSEMGLNLGRLTSDPHPNHTTSTFKQSAPPKTEQAKRPKCHRF